LIANLIEAEELFGAREAKTSAAHKSPGRLADVGLGCLRPRTIAPNAVRR
jgi:hypothetical protein